MSPVPTWRRYLRFRGPNVRADVDDELAFHVEVTAAEYMARGESPERARLRALEEFGNLTAARRQCYAIGERRRRRAYRGELFIAFGQDLRFALRRLRESPGFTFAVTAMIAVAMSANAIAFSLIDRLIIGPPAFMTAASDVRRVYQSTLLLDHVGLGTRMSYLRFTDVAAHASAFSAMAAVHERDVVLRVGTAERGEIVRVANVGGDFWSFFSAMPVIGRLPVRADEAPGATPVVVLSFDLWRSRFHSDVDVLGSTISLAGTTFRVIGVAPAKFTGIALAAPAAFVPVSASPQISALGRPLIEAYGAAFFEVIARLRTDWSDERATADLTAALRWSGERQRTEAKTLNTLLPKDATGVLGPIQAGRGPLQGTEARVALWLGALAGIVLLVAALNVANLMLARMVRRQREIAVRLALGVSALRLLRLLFTEAAVIVGAGSVLSAGIVWWTGDIVRDILPNTQLPPVGLDARVVGFIIVSAIIAALIIALAPGLRALRWRVVAAINDGGAARTLGRSRARNAMLALQIAFSLVLLVSAGLFVRSLRNVRGLPLGYDPRHVVVIGTVIGIAPFPGVPEALAQRLVANATSIAGVESGALAVSVPFTRQVGRRFSAPGADPSALRGRFVYNAVSTDYFRTMGTRIIDGRAFTESDDASAAHVAIVTAPMAARLWPGRSAIGQCLAFRVEEDDCVRVVGVVEPSRHWSYEQDEMLAYFAPFAQMSQPVPPMVVFRTTEDAHLVAERIQRTLQADAPDGVRMTAAPMQDKLDAAAQSWRIGATMLSLLATLALALAAVGIYGVVAHDLAERQRDVGIRVALGASPSHLMLAGVTRRIGVAVTGIGVGAALSLVVGAALRTLLFGVSGSDPTTFLIAGGVTMLAFVAASVIPALRAARADPAAILRSG